MGIRAEKERWSLEGLKLEVDKHMSKSGPRKIDMITIHVLPPSNLTDDKLKILKQEIKDCPVLRNIQSSTNINLLWTQQ
jgi:uncharacterized OsmC-like protein